MEDQRENDLSLSKAMAPGLNKESIIQIQFNLVEKNWPFIKFSDIFRRTDSFLLVEQKIKNYHGSIKNLQLYSESTLKKKQKCKKCRIQYNFKDKIESKLNILNAQPGTKQAKIIIYYKYDNGYEWPLLTSQSFKPLTQKKQVQI